MLSHMDDPKTSWMDDKGLSALSSWISIEDKGLSMAEVISCCVCEGEGSAVSVNYG